MNIQYKNYRIEQDTVNPATFNLTKLMQRVRKKDNEQYKEYSPLAYNMTIPNAIKRIVALEASDDTGIYSLSEFLDRYSAITREVLEAIQSRLEPR